MKIAMFVLGIIELALIFLAAILNCGKVDLNNWNGLNEITSIGVVSVILLIAITLSILSIVAFCK